MRRSQCATLLLAAALPLAACGSAASSGSPGSQSTTTTTTPTTSSGPGRHIVLITSATTGITQAAVGETIEVELTSKARSRAGAVVPWGAPSSSDLRVVARTTSPSGVMCGADATCTFFAARGAGSATITVGGPSGILCGVVGTGCLAVTAALHSFRLVITPA